MSRNPIPSRSFSQTVIGIRCSKIRGLSFPQQANTNLLALLLRSRTSQLCCRSLVRTPPKLGQPCFGGWGWRSAILWMRSCGFSVAGISGKERVWIPDPAIIVHADSAVGCQITPFSLLAHRTEPSGIVTWKRPRASAKHIGNSLGSIGLGRDKTWWCSSVHCRLWEPANRFP